MVNTTMMEMMVGVDAKVELQRWAMAVRYREAQVQAIKAKEAPAKVNEVALEVSAVNEVNEESTVNEDDRVVCNFKEVAPEVSYSTIKEVELHIAHNVQVEIGAEVQEEQNGTKDWEPGESGVAKPEVRSDVNVEAKAEVFGMNEVKNLKDDKAQVEMLDAKEAMILVNINKVGLQLFTKEVWSSGGAIEKALLIVMFLLKERFVNGFSPLSDYG